MEKKQQYIDEGFLEGKKSFKYLSKQVYENFDWNKVHKAMIAVEWYWDLGKDKYGKPKKGIPSIETIQNAAYDLLKRAYEGECQVSSGGFTAVWENGELYLSFTLEYST